MTLSEPPRRSAGNAEPPSRTRRPPPRYSAAIAAGPPRRRTHRDRGIHHGRATQQRGRRRLAGGSARPHLPPGPRHPRTYRHARWGRWRCGGCHRRARRRLELPGPHPRRPLRPGARRRRPPWPPSTSRRPPRPPPAGSQDVAAAVAWVATHADELGVDPGRIALIGSSSGGHLALYAALTMIDVRWVGAFWPPTDPLGRYRYAQDRIGRPVPDG
ncbi:MAG: alpha/beta hydrolase fold domain-containing protein [Acidimicrobiales bacterium]